jgi:hypothetical protein
MPVKIPKMGAPQIVALLRARHAQDVFVDECRDGTTQRGSHRRLDAWAMHKSWAPWTTVGYEVKVSRSDFENDQKWPGYLPLCHHFYLVCPTGLIRAVDLPDYVGLIWVTANGERLHTKVKAMRREPDATELCQLLSYVVMNRSRIVGDLNEANRPEPPPTPDKLEAYRTLVEQAEKRDILAAFVNGHVRATVDRYAQYKAHADRVFADAEEFASRLSQLGVTWDPAEKNWHKAYTVHQEINALDQGLGPHGVRQLRHARDRLTQAIELIERARGGNR